MAVTDKLVVVMDADTQRLKGQLFKLGNVFQETFRKMEMKLKRFSYQMNAVGRKMTTSITMPMALIGGAGLRMAGNFEQAMNQVTAVSGATGAQFAALRDKAKELGETTQYSAGEVASAMSFMAMAGMKPKEILGGIADTLKLAASAQMDLGQAADIVTNILTGYQMKVSQLGASVDVLVGAFTSANTNLSQLGEAFKYAGSYANSTSQEFIQTTAALALMGNAGIQASMAGTGLRRALSRLDNPNAEIKRAMDAIHMSVRRAGGGLVDLRDIIRQLEPHIKNSALFMSMFGDRAGPAMLGLVSQGLPAFDMLTEKLEKSGGLAKKIADVQMRGLNGQLRALRSALEALAIAIGDSGVLKFFTALAQRAAELVREMAKLSPQTLRLISITAGLVGVLGPLSIMVAFIAKSFRAASVAVVAFYNKLLIFPAIVAGVFVASKALGRALRDMVDGIFESGDKAGKGFKEAFMESLTGDWDWMKEKFNAMFGNLLEDVVGPEAERKLQQQIADLNADIKQQLAKMAGKGGAIQLPIGIDETDKKIDAAKEKLARLNTEALRAEGRHVEALQAEFNAELASYRKMLDQKLISLTEFEKVRANLQTIHAKKLAEAVDEQSQRLKDAMQSVASNIESALSSAFDTGKFKAADMVRAIIKDLAMLQIRAAVLQPLFGGGPGGGTGALGKMLAGVFHGGGIAGLGGARRGVPALAFANAPRFHAGGIAGLRPNEVPAILERGERVIPKDERSSRSGSGVPIVFNITTPDADSFRRSEGQITAMLARAANRGRRGL